MLAEERKVPFKQNKAMIENVRKEKLVWQDVSVQDNATKCEHIVVKRNVSNEKEEIKLKKLWNRE